MGFSVARLTTAGLSPAEITAAILDARRTGHRLLYVEVTPADRTGAAVVRAAGAWLADRKVTFIMELPMSDPLASAAGIQTTTEFTLQLETLAWQSGEYSRFRRDPRFGPDVFQQMYSQWLRNSLSHQIARQVLVFRDAAGTERGLLTLGEKNEHADIGLLAVDAAVRGQRVGQRLVAAAAQQARAWGYHALQVVTQLNNETACRFYEKCGFALLHEQHIYHLWLN